MLAGIGCETAPPKAPVIGKAFVGPAKLEIHREILPKSPISATVHYGDQLEVIGQRRHFFKVRTSAGVEGWVDDRNLLDAAAIQALKQLAADAKKSPSQGLATTYDTLNVHAEPDRLSPSYLQVQPGERVDVIGHRTAPRVGPKRKALVIARPKPPRPVKEKKKKVIAITPPPLPPPPAVPSDWLELSKRRDPDEPEPGADSIKATPSVPPVAAASPPDDWTLIRTKSGQAGWVLTRRIYMAIPDEVAQYSEGRRSLLTSH